MPWVFHTVLRNTVLHTVAECRCRHNAAFLTSDNAALSLVMHLLSRDLSALRRKHAVHLFRGGMPDTGCPAMGPYPPDMAHRSSLNPTSLKYS